MTSRGARQSAYVYRTPYGLLSVVACGRAITGVTLGDIRENQVRNEAGITLAPSDTSLWKPTDLTNRCATELLEYFSGKRRAFDLDVAPAGTEFQKAVWKAVMKIPYGRTRSPRELAAAIGKPTSYRMVGAAVKACPVAIIIPTHRVIGSNGRPLGVDSEARLRTACLKLEQKQIQSL